MARGARGHVRPARAARPSLTVPGRRATAPRRTSAAWCAPTAARRGPPAPARRSSRMTRRGASPAAKPLLRLTPQRRPGVGPRPLPRPRRCASTRARCASRGPLPRPSEAPRPRPGPHEGRHEVPPRPASLELGAPMARAQPHRDPVGQVQLRPLPLPPAHAQQARRTVPQPLPLVEGLRHEPSLPDPRPTDHDQGDPRDARGRVGPRAFGRPSRGQVANWRIGPSARGPAAIQPHRPSGPADEVQPALSGSAGPRRTQVSALTEQCPRTGAHKGAAPPGRDAPEQSRRGPAAGP